MDLLVAKVLWAAIEVLRLNPIVQRRRSLAAECSDSSPFRQGFAQLVAVPYGALMYPTRHFASCVLGPSL